MRHFERPEDVLDQFHIYGSLTVADFGAGAGYFSLPAAARLSNKGTVFAIDIQEEPLRVLRKAAHEQNLHAIHTLRGDLELPRGSHLKPESVDRVIVTNILFQAENKTAILKEAYRVLKKGGTLVTVEWHPHERTPVGPKREHRVDSGQLRTMLKFAGFEPEEEFELGAHHYGMFAKKP